MNLILSGFSLFVNRRIRYRLDKCRCLRLSELRGIKLQISFRNTEVSPRVSWYELLRLSIGNIAGDDAEAAEGLYHIIYVTLDSLRVRIWTIAQVISTQILLTKKIFTQCTHFTAFVAVKSEDMQGSEAVRRSMTSVGQ